MSTVDSGMFEKVLSRIIVECEKSRGILSKIKMLLVSFSDDHSNNEIFGVLAQVIANKAAGNPEFYGELVEIIGDIIMYEEKMQSIRQNLGEENSEDGKLLFSVLYPAMYS